VIFRSRRDVESCMVRLMGRTYVIHTQRERQTDDGCEVVEETTRATRRLTLMKKLYTCLSWCYRRKSFGYGCRTPLRVYGGYAFAVLTLRTTSLSYSLSSHDERRE